MVGLEAESCSIECSRREPVRTGTRHGALVSRVPIHTTGWNRPINAVLPSSALGQNISVSGGLLQRVATVRRPRSPELARGSGLRNAEHFDWGVGVGGVAVPELSGLVVAPAFDCRLLLKSPCITPNHIGCTIFSITFVSTSVIALRPRATAATGT